MAISLQTGLGQPDKVNTVGSGIRRPTDEQGDDARVLHRTIISGTGSQTQFGRYF